MDERSAVKDPGYSLLSSTNKEIDGTGDGALVVYFHSNRTTSICLTYVLVAAQPWNIYPGCLSKQSKSIWAMARSPVPADTAQTSQLLVQERTSKRKRYIDVQIRMDVIAISKRKRYIDDNIDAKGLDLNDLRIQLEEWKLVGKRVKSRVLEVNRGV
ncbi:hypothetical protein V6N13_134575 [Hibiscus sabdariffa]